MTLAPQMRTGIELLAMNLPELRLRLDREMSENPCIEDVEQSLVGDTVSGKLQEAEERTDGDAEGYPEDDFEPEYGTASAITADEEANERRQRFFDSQTKEETLEEHLLAQLEMADVPPEDMPVAELIIGELDDNGFFIGSIPDLVMVTGEDEAKIQSVRERIMQLDPPGCAARNAKECLLAQMDKLDGSPFQDDVRELVENHLEDVGNGRIAAVEHAMGISHERYADILRELRTLDPFPGRAFAHGGKSVSYVNPEVHAVKTKDGWWADVDERSLPEIHISPKYEKMLSDPNVDRKTKSYIRERIASAKAIIEAVERRQETIRSIAQAIIDAQPDVFAQRTMNALRPLTMQQVVDVVGVHGTTVSRTVRNKYMRAPFGTVELRKFFTGGLATESGETVSNTSVQRQIRELIAAEDATSPLSDDRIAAILKAKGITIARLTVAKYRIELGIPGAIERRLKS
jgi:RNA polymerase sigma-54 factor